MTLWDALRELARTLDEREVPYMVGGLANLHWGKPRTTLDIDVTVDASDDEIVALADSIRAILVEEPAAFLQRARVLPIRLPDRTRVDLVAATLPFERDAIAPAVSAPMEGAAIRLCSAEDLIVHKIVSRRDRDLRDIEGILKRQGSALDMRFLRDTIETLSREADDPSILERFEVALLRARE